MTASLARTAPTCLGCLRRSVPRESGLRAATASLIQVRGKKYSKQPKDHGVVVRLLEDIPKFGRKGYVLRTERGRMRNFWFPNKRAEYMTVARFEELSLSPDHVGVRQTDFGVGSALEAEEPAEEGRPAVRIQTASPQRAADLLVSLLPPTLAFRRLPIHAPDASDETSTPSPGASPVATFGSVSTEDIAAEIRQLLQGDAEGSLVRVDARNVRFVSLADGQDRVKSLGRWDIEITVGSDADEIGPVTKVVKVVAQT